jgi:vacuolar-type H+-ATPase subunit H
MGADPGGDCKFKQITPNPKHFSYFHVPFIYLIKIIAMKKFIRILLITLGVILLLLVLVPVLFRSRIEAAVKKQINENVHATVDWSRFSVTFFRGFPDLSVNLHRVSVVGVDDFEGDTLAGFDRFELRVDLISIIKKDILVRSILIDHPVINGIVLEDGTANWDIAIVTAEDQSVAEEGGAETPVPETVETGDAGVSMGVALERFAIKSGRLYYRDAEMDVDASLEDLNLELAGDFSLEETDLGLEAESNRVNATYGGIRYMRNGNIGLSLLASANMVENTYTLHENEIRLNGLVLGTEGVVTMPEGGGMDMDLRFFTKETSFRTLLSMVPAIYLQDFESIKASGSLALEGTLKGMMIDSLLPDASLKLEVNDGYFAYPDLPKDVSDVQIRMVVNYDGKAMDRTTVDLERFHLLLGGNPFDISLHVDHPVSDMHVAGAMKGMIDLASLKDVVPLEDLELNGRLTADMSVDTRMSTIEQEHYEDVNLDGTLVIEGVQVESPELPVPVDLQKMELNFNPRFVELAGLDLQMGRSDFHLEGSLLNFIPYVFEGATVSGSLNVTSRMVDANELMSSDDQADTALMTAQVTEEFLPDSLAEPAQMKIPENIDFTIALDLRKVVYEDILMENINGSMRISQGVANLEGLLVDVIEGRVTASGVVDTRGDFTEADLSLDLQGVDIPSAYTTFVTVERLAPMARYCRGNANVKLTYHSLLDASFSPLYNSIDANGRIFTRNLQVYNTNTFVRLSELLKNEKFREMTPDEMDIKFRIRNGRVMVDPFQVDFSKSKIIVSGSHGIDMTMDYLLDMEIAKSDLGEGASELMSGINALAAGAGFKIPESDHVKVKARITGTFQDPKITTDLTGNLQSARESVIEAVEQRVTEEVQKVEEQVREEAGEKADQILKEAEEEADRIMEEARVAGEKLVGEAKLKGENLVKEAGSNPIKKLAAQKTADEMVRQAEKQSETLQREARVKADKVLENARAEADKI